jgi:hypothetical protein
METLDRIVVADCRLQTSHALHNGGEINFNRIGRVDARSGGGTDIRGGT